MLYLADLLAADHQNELLREADAERRAALVRGARRSAWSLILGQLGGFIGRVAGSARGGSAAARPGDPRPASA